jgi:hypothetical protein
MARKHAVPRDMLIEDLIERHPSAVGFLMREGVVCMKCGEPIWGSVGEAIRRKGLDVEVTIAKLEAFLREDAAR